MLTSVRLTLKQHRFEVGAALIAALALGVVALVVVYQLRAIVVPAGCFDKWLAVGPDAAGDCYGPVEAFATINEDEAGKVLAAMAVLPFLVGLLSGVPIVGRELESRTAQTAWWLNGSRLRWLVRQLAPVAILIAVAVTFAALAADVLETTREPWYHSGFSDMDLHGLPVVARAFAALGLGLLVGALLGRTLPAFIVGAVLSFVLVYGAGMAQTTWLDAQKPVVIGDSPEGQPIDFHGLTTAQVWVTPQGAQLGWDEAMAQAPQGRSDPEQWLRDNGYKLVDLGLSEEVVLGWAPYEALGFGLAGVALFAAAVVVVNRRRPT